MQESTFAELIKSARKNKLHLPVVKILLLGDTSLQLLNQTIKGCGVEDLLNIEVDDFEFNAIDLSIIGLADKEANHPNEIICIIENSYSLWLKFTTLNTNEKLSFANNYLNKISNQIAIIQSKKYTNIIIANFAEFDDSVWGSFANKTEYSFLYQLRKINWGLIELAKESMSLNILDISNIAQQIGLSNLYDYRLYETASMIFSMDSLPKISKKIVDSIRVQRGDIIKCIVVDLDNTLWNGVISEDGIEEIGLGDYNNGKSFVAFQKWLKLLKNRGVILAVCSKNDQYLAELPFLNHPSTVLKLDDFTIFMANWNSKVDNIKEIQRKLNIGFNSMVFIDDNPFERNIVKEFIPEIIVPSIPENPENRLPFLISLNLFGTNSFTNEDLERIEFYKAEVKRHSQEFQFTDTRNYLLSLEMKAKIENLNEFNIPRFSQLSIRSNQFNLRTIRYSPSDLIHIQSDSNRIIYSISLKDNFGDYGIVSGVVTLLDQTNKIAFIESWFMSCRVLKRGLEQFVLNHLVKELQELGIREIQGEIIENEKNKLIYNFYSEFGFEKADQIWTLNLAKYQLQNTEIQSNV